MPCNASEFESRNKMLWPVPPTTIVESSIQLPMEVTLSALRSAIRFPVATSQTAITPLSAPPAIRSPFGLHATHQTSCNSLLGFDNSKVRMTRSDSASSTWIGPPTTAIFFLSGEYRSQYTCPGNSSLIRIAESVCRIR